MLFSMKQLDGLAAWCIKPIYQSLKGFNCKNRIKIPPVTLNSATRCRSHLGQEKVTNIHTKWHRRQGKSCVREEGTVQCPVSSFLCNTCFLGVIQNFVTFHGRHSVFVIVTLAQLFSVKNSVSSYHCAKAYQHS